MNSCFVRLWSVGGGRGRRRQGCSRAECARRWWLRSGHPASRNRPEPHDGCGEHTRSEPPPPRTVHRHSVRGQVLAALRTALVDGELAPGEVYSAPVLAERLGVSATPVREAMQQLSIEGAVEVVPNRGFRVTERSPRELAELAEVRAMIEVPVMLRLARTVPASRWAELRPLADATTAAAATGDRAGLRGVRPGLPPRGPRPRGQRAARPGRRRPAPALAVAADGGAGRPPRRPDRRRGRTPGPARRAVRPGPHRRPVAGTGALHGVRALSGGARTSGADRRSVESTPLRQEPVQPT